MDNWRWYNKDKGASSGSSSEVNPSVANVGAVDDNSNRYPLSITWETTIHILCIPSGISKLVEPIMTSSGASTQNNDDNASDVI